MAASFCPCVTWRFTSPHVLAASPEPRVWSHALVGAGLVVRGGYLSCKGRLVVQVGDLSEMQPSGQGLVVLPVRVLTKICMPSLRRNARWRVLSFWML
jgi:hypothetical protein